MRRFTWFSGLYLTIGICFTIIAADQRDSASLFVGSLLTAGLAYVQAFLSLLPWQQQRQLQLQARLRQYPRWQQIVMQFWVVAVLFLIFLVNLLTHNLSVQFIPSIGVLLIVIVITLEALWLRRRLN